MPSPSNFLYLSDSLQNFSEYQSTRSNISWDDVNRQVVIVNNRTVHFIPVHGNNNDETYPPVTTMVYVHLAVFLISSFTHQYSRIPDSLLNTPIKQAKVSPSKSKLAIFDHDKQIVCETRT
jgi:N6-adenosine-specific RNA methylase IME4